MLLTALAGCGPFSTTHRVLQEIPSPSGEWKAIVTIWEPPGGALADTQVSVHVVRASDDTPMWLRARTRARAQWFSEELFPSYLFWRDDRQLEVVVPRAPSGGGSWFRDRQGAFRIVTRLAERLDKASLQKLDDLPVVRPR